MDSAATAVAPWMSRSEKAMLSVSQIKELLKLEPLPLEGGFFAEAYRSGFTNGYRDGYGRIG